MNPTRDHTTKALTPEGMRASKRTLAAEVPVSLTYNGVAHVVMMMTPDHLEDFAFGFSLSEQIVRSPDGLLSVRTRTMENGILLDVEIAKDCHVDLLEGRRNMVGQTSCGICGVVELEHAVRDLEPIEARPAPDRDALFAALKDVRTQQTLNAETGAVHAAAFCAGDGTIAALREDVGRHNAMDKLIGHMAREGMDAASGFILLTSRCSYELVQKAVVTRVPLLAAISAPTALAVELAEAHGLTLVALARSDEMLCFNDPHGIFD